MEEANKRRHVRLLRRPRADSFHVEALVVPGVYRHQVRAAPTPNFFVELFLALSEGEVFVVSATPTEKPSMLCILYLTILKTKESPTTIVSDFLTSHLSQNSYMVNIACMCR
jgi:hypothetical protein